MCVQERCPYIEWINSAWSTVKHVQLLFMLLKSVQMLLMCASEMERSNKFEKCSNIFLHICLVCDERRFTVVSGLGVTGLMSAMLLVL